MVSDEDIPRCHACKSNELPFAVTPTGAQWRHDCGAIVCPACGDPPAPGQALCALCDEAADALPSAAEMQRRVTYGQ